MTEKYTLFKSALGYPNRNLAVLLMQVEQQKQLMQQIKAVLPENLLEHVRYCVLKDKKLLIYTKSAAWASQIRFYQQTILAAIAPMTSRTIALMQVKVLLENTSLLRESVRKAKLPSAATIELVQNQGLAVSDDELKSALLKLSATLKKLSG